MAKKIIISALLLLSALFCIQNKGFAQRFKIESHIIGIGFGPAIKYSHKGANKPSYAAKFSYEKGIGDFYPGALLFGSDISVAEIRHITPDSISYYGDPMYSATWSHYAVAAKLTYYHNGKRWGLDHLHIFGGFSLGFRYESFIEQYRIPHVSGDAVSEYAILAQDPGTPYHFHWTIHAGASYHIIPNLATYLDFGYTESWLSIGMLYTLGMRRMPKVSI